MKKLLTLLLILWTVSANAQLGSTREKITSEYGYNFEEKTSIDGYKYITYTEYEGTQLRVFYFDVIDGQEICYRWMLFNDKSEANEHIKYYNDNFVSVGELSWRDYSTKTNYKIRIEEGMCITEVTAAK